MTESSTEKGIAELLLKGRASTATEAEAMFLDEHLEDVLRLVASPLSDAEFRNHPLIRLLMAHGSRLREDALT